MKSGVNRSLEISALILVATPKSITVRTLWQISGFRVIFFFFLSHGCPAEAYISQLPLPLGVTMWLSFGHLNERSEMLVRMWRKGNPCTLLVGMLISAATLKNSMEISQKTKNRAGKWPSNSTPGYISPKKPENTNSKRYMHSNVHSSIIYNSQDMEATYVFINRWMEKEDETYIQLNITRL